MDGVLDKPAPAALLTQWTPQPIAICLAAVLVLGYAHGYRRVGGNWSRGRTAVFAFGILLLVWTSCGFLQVYARSLYWVWTTQTLLLWLVVPIVVLFGQPVQLAHAATGGQLVDRLLSSRPARVVGNPLVGPALVPVLSGVLFFGPLPEWTARWIVAHWLVQLVLLIIGAFMVLPLVGLGDDASSLAVGLSLGIGCFELVLDALPGVVLRLRNGLVTGWFDHRTLHPWTPGALHDQRVAGAILWCIAEIIDLPFLVLVYRRWLRVDARDAAEVDAVLDAERAARQALRTEDEPAPLVDRDEPWWLSDPALRERYRE
jgi:cytochrome c oxidase assembly factor CtaG